MTNKSIRDYINLIENAQREYVAEAEKKPHPQTWHDVDPKLGKAVDKMSQAEKVKKGYAHPDTLKKKGVAEGLNEFAPDGFNNGGGDDGEEFNPRLAKMAQEDGFTKGVSLADGATLERAMKIQHWDQHDGGMYKQYFAKGFKAGRMNKINHDNKRYNLNLKLMKDGSIRHGEQGVAEEQLEETSPEAIAKIEQLTRK